jgi:hypothetical protein
MNTPMIGFRLDPRLTEAMDARCEDLNISRAEWLRSLIVSEVGSLPGEATGDDQAAIAPGQLQGLVDRIDGLESLLENYEGWVRRQIAPVADRVAAIEAVLKKRGVL